MNLCQVCIFIIRGLHCAKLAFNKIRIHKQSTILPVVIIKLRIGNCTCKTNTILTSFVHCMKCMTIDHSLQSHFLKLQYGSFNHTFKSQLITDIYCLLLPDIFSACNKAHTVPFCISTCHTVYFFLGHGV